MEIPSGKRKRSSDGIKLSVNSRAGVGIRSWKALQSSALSTLFPDPQLSFFPPHFKRIPSSELN